MGLKRFAVRASALSVLLVMTLIAIASSPSTYDPWLDGDQNGIIDVADLALMAKAYGTTGNPKREFPTTASYVIRNNGSHTYAIHWGGHIDFCDTDAATVINNAISSALSEGGGKIVIRKSPTEYELTQELEIYADNLVLEADKGTILKVVADLQRPINICGSHERPVKNIRVTGLVIDGGYRWLHYAVTGLVSIRYAENIILDGIEVMKSGRERDRLVCQAGICAHEVHKLWVTSCYIHEIQGSGIWVSSFPNEDSVSSEIYICHNNIINCTADVEGPDAGILVRARNFFIDDNYIYRAHFGVSLPNGGWKTSVGCVTNNIMIGNAGSEKIAESGIEIFGEGTSYVHIMHNYFEKWCWEYKANPGYGGGFGIEVGNTYSSYTGDGVHHNVIAYNTINATGYTLETVGIALNGKYNKVYGNQIIGANYRDIKEYGVSDYNEIYDNLVTHTNPEQRIDLEGWHSKTKNNQGWNPKGVLSSPFTGNTVGLRGASQNPTADTDYRVYGVDVLVTSFGGTAVNITIKDNAGNMVAYNLTTLSATYLPMEYKINFGSFTSAPTVIVSGN